MLKWILNLQLFADGGDGAATGSDGSGDAAVHTGVLHDGTQVDDRLAARINQQRKRHPGMKQVAPAQEPEAQKQPERTPDDEWNDLKKGKYAEQYGRDVKAAVDARFKNQADANETLAFLQPMLNALAEKNGVKADDLKALSEKILDDDSLYEEAAEEHGMTVSAYKSFKALQDEAEQNRRREALARQNQEFENHLANLAKQGEALRQKFPQFDLKTEMNNPDFVRLTAPNSGLNVEQAYVAIHHDELISGAMSYGIQRTQQQIANTLQANRSRPSEGAMQTAPAVDVAIDPRNMTRAQREELKRQARMGKRVVF